MEFFTLRKIGRLANKEEIEVFTNYLYYYDIESFCHDNPGDLDIWILKDHEIDQAKEHLETFNQSFLRSSEQKGKDTDSLNQHNEIIKKSEEGAKKLETDSKKQFEKEKKLKFINVRQSMFKQSGFNPFSATGILIILCVLIFLLSLSQARESIYRLLLISQIGVSNQYGIPAFYEVSHGQFWRLVSPIFLHHDFFHIIFNMIWLYQIGTQIEKKEGPIAYLVMICVVAMCSNVAYYMAAGPSFGGMSGVIYGFIGYIWGYRKINPTASYLLDEGMVRFFMFWYVLCWFLTIFGFGVANTVHGIGALSGIGCGMVRAYFKEKNALPLKRLLNQDTMYVLAILIVLSCGALYTDHIYYFR